MLTHRRLCFWSYTVASGAGRVVRDVDATSFADTKDGHIGDFVTVPYLNRHRSPAWQALRIKHRDARCPKHFENANECDQPALTTSFCTGASLFLVRTFPPSFEGSLV